MTHSRRTPRIAKVVAAAVLSLGSVLAVAGPASADVAEEVHALEHTAATGQVRSPDGVFEKGCQSHRYTYRVDADGQDWELELFLVDSRKRQIANGYEWQGADPAKGNGRFEFCSQATRPGRFTIKARLAWDDGEEHVKRLASPTIRLRRG